MELDFSRLDVFASDTNKQVELARKIDDILDGSEDYVPSFMLMGLDPQTKISVDEKNAPFRKVIKSIKAYLRSIGGDLEEKTVGKNKAYRYAQANYSLSYPNRSPFAAHRKVTKKVNLSESISRLKEIVGFLPDTLQRDLFDETEILVSNELAKAKGKSYISPESNILLTGIRFLPELYRAIVNHTVLLVEYSKRYSYVEQQELHPHFLKEYNGRWYVCGRTVSLDNEKIVREEALLALDRIVDIDEAMDSSNYHECPNGHYENFFDDIVGVTHDNQWNLESIAIRVHDKYVFNLLKTKKLHSTQTETEEDGICTINLMVRPNRELTAKLLSFGSALEIEAPFSYREFVAHEIAIMHNRY